MSSQKTKNYQLHAWEGEDKFLRSEINENFATLDSAIAQNAVNARNDLNSSHSQLASSLNRVSVALSVEVDSKVGIVFGSYAGTYDGTDPSNYAQTISLGFTPKAVLLMSQLGANWNSYATAYLAAPGFPAGNSSSPGVVVQDGGFQVSQAAANSNNAGTVYYYIAFR